MSKPISFSTISLTVISFFLLIVASSARAGWYPLNIGDTNSALHGIEITSDDQIVAVGENGTVFLSNNNGADWTTPSTGISETLYSVDSADEFRLFSVGASGTILRSIDKGNSWQEQSTSTTKDLHAIDMATTNIGTAVGNGGTIITTANSGLTWTTQDPPSNANLRGVTHLTNSSIWAVGNSGTLIKSTDQGETWTKRTIATSENLNDIAFGTSLIGIIIGENGTVFKTTDGGASWSEIENSIEANLYAIDMLDENNALVVGDGVILVSADGGTSWYEEEFTNVDPMFHDVVYSSLESSWAVGENEDGGFIDAFDNTIPTTPENLAIEDGTPTSDATPTFSWDAATDTGNAVSHYVIEIDSWSWESDSTSFTLPTALADGEYTVYVYAVDEAGNNGASASLDFEILEGSSPVDGVEANTLIKLPCDTEAEVNDPCRAVYYYSSSNARHAFPNEQVFFTWYEDFDDVTEVSEETMASIPLGSNVTYRPGVKMVKFITVNTVYAVSGTNTLRAIDEESTAEALYGENWNQQIGDIPDVFFNNYEFGDEITDPNDYDSESQIETYQTIEDIL